MKRNDEEIKPKREEENLEVDKHKKGFKIEIVKVGKLEENTAGAANSYAPEQ